MKLERVQFKGNKFDPKTSRGADNVRSFYRADQGYDIELDEPLGVVRVSINGRHNLVPLDEVSEARAFDEVTPQSALVAPKTEAVKVAEGAYVIRRKPVDVDPEPAPAAAPRKRGRPPKAKPVSAQ